ncbi:MAG: 2-oxoacid:ferredoxin oxidoreductase subunit beta [Magnetovibrionaceae bacterium]
MDTHAEQNKPLTVKDYKSDTKPVWCPGCGDFSVLQSILRALATLQLKREDVSIVSGIGCSSRIPAYTSVYGFHGVHGRALAIASGLKLARPDQTVIAAGGDGDGFSIGGNHFIHACRRNVDITYVVMDNQVYGMTKGQASPTTGSKWEGSKLTPHGSGVEPFKPLDLAFAAGCNFIARGHAGDPNGAAEMILAGICHPGFSLIHILSPCITFRPEEKEWKKIIGKDKGWGATNDVAEAHRRLMSDSGFDVGIFYAGDRPPYQPPLDTNTTIADLEAEFRLA